ncbi:MAG TPA: Ig-like domain-containing protein [Vicinamibacterales bacterium]
MRRSSIAVSFATVLVFGALGCGADANTVTGTPTEKPTPAPAPVARVEFVRLSSRDVMVNDSTTFLVRALDADGRPINDAYVALSASSGSLSPTTIATDPDGTEIITWRTGNVSGPATVTATAWSGYVGTYSQSVSRSIVGRWYGDYGSSIISVTITHHDQPFTPAVQGTASLSGFTGPQSFRIVGSCSGAEVSLAIDPADAPTVSFVGTLSPDGKTITGRLTGPSFDHTVATLTRAP